MTHLDMGDDSGAAGLAFAFGGDGHPDLITVMAERRPQLRLLQELFSQGRNIFFNGGVFFCQLFKFAFKGRRRDDLKAHRGVD